MCHICSHRCCNPNFRKYLFSSLFETVILKHFSKLLIKLSEFWHSGRSYLFSAMAFGIAMYVTPNWTLPRVFGSLLEYYWRKKYPRTHSKYKFLLFIFLNSIPAFYLFSINLQSNFTAYNLSSHFRYMFIVASGFVLGEGILSIFTALLKNPGGVHPWSCGGCAPGLCSC